MKCPHCQNEMPIEDAKFCAYCQKPINSNETPSNEPPASQIPSQEVVYCSTCGNPCHTNAVVCVKCGSPISKGRANKVEVDEIVPALKWLSFFIPIVGLILYIVKVQSAPKSAKEYGKMALIGFGISLGLAVLVPLMEEMLWYIF